MDYVAVTLSSPSLSQPRDLLLPLDIPQYILIDSLLDALNIKTPDRSKGVMFVIVDGKKRILPLQATLGDVGVKFGQFLALEFMDVTSKASLICLQGPEFDLNNDETTIGCRPGVDIDLRSVPHQEFVSANHAKICFHDGTFHLEDLKSKNGTILNNSLVLAGQEYVLNDGDIILLGANEGKGIQLVFNLRK
jgi:uncharacterized ubiquitin-like protein YukD